jgi:alanyl-tRNA synthetase
MVADGKQVKSLKAGDKASIVVNQTTFYAESGGQTGDHGVINAAGGGRFKVKGTEKRVGDLVIHMGEVEHGTLALGDAVELNVDHTRRSGNRRHHSATHLLHEALRKTLGSHVAQKGSLVEPNRLRFDFSHNKGMSPEELGAVETMANDIVLQNAPVNTRLMSVDAAVAEGAMALFGEKYGEEVRVVSMGRNEEGASRPIYSLELCGGTHVSRTGDIGLIKILAESGSAAGVRRLEALAGPAAREYLEMQDKRVAAAAAVLKTSPSDLVSRIENLLDERKKLERELAEAKKTLALGGGSASGENDIKIVNGINFMTRILKDMDSKTLKGLVDESKTKLGSGVVALLSTGEDGKASLYVGVTADLTSRISAIDLVRAGATALGGKGGGGRPDLAQAGGPDAGKADEALAAIKAVIAS